MFSTRSQKSVSIREGDSISTTSPNLLNIEPPSLGEKLFLFKADWGFSGAYLVPLKFKLFQLFYFSSPSEFEMDLNLRLDLGKIKLYPISKTSNDGDSAYGYV